MIYKLLNFVINNIVSVSFMLMIGYVLFNAKKRTKQTKEAKKLIAKAISTGMNEPLTLHPVIDPTLCGGCGACTKVCPEGDILKLVNHKAQLVSPTKCVGHGECEKACPMDAIKLVFGTKTRGMDIPRVSKDYETNRDIVLAIRKFHQCVTVLRQGGRYDVEKVVEVVILDTFAFSFKSKPNFKS